jgi:putative acetyltransferase
MQIREFQPADAGELKTLFYNTVHQVNRRDYSPRQIEVWSSAAKDEQLWHTRLQTGRIYVAEAEEQTIGFISLQENGHIAALFCHCDHQRKGVGTQLLNHAEQVARSLGIEHLSSEVSITARPFFLHHGFRVMQAQMVERQGVTFRNFFMEKVLR